MSRDERAVVAPAFDLMVAYRAGRDTEQEFETLNQKVWSLENSWESQRAWKTLGGYWGTHHRHTQPRHIDSNQTTGGRTHRWTMTESQEKHD